MFGAFGNGCNSGCGFGSEIIWIIVLMSILGGCGKNECHDRCNCERKQHGCGIDLCTLLILSLVCGR